MTGERDFIFFTLNFPDEQVDLTKRRVVDEGEGRLWAESRGFHYFETSAQSGEGINEMFQVSAAVHTHPWKKRRR